MITDAGGERTADGRQVRRGRLFRVSGDLMGDADLEVIDLVALRAIVDMRGDSEDRRALMGWADEHGVAYHHQPIEVLGAVDLASRILRAPDAGSAQAEMEGLYRVIVDEHGGSLAGAIEVLAQGTPAAFGCAAGKDRTGITGALLLTALGVPRAQVVAAYVALAPPPQRLLARLRDTKFLEDAPAEAPGVRVMLGATAPTMQATLDHIEAVHGGVERYLADRGVGPERLAALRADLLEPA